MTRLSKSFVSIHSGGDSVSGTQWVISPPGFSLTSFIYFFLIPSRDPVWQMRCQRHRRKWKKTEIAKNREEEIGASFLPPTDDDGLQYNTISCFWRHVTKDVSVDGSVYNVTHQEGCTCVSRKPTALILNEILCFWLCITGYLYLCAITS